MNLNITWILHEHSKYKMLNHLLNIDLQKSVGNFQESENYKH